MATAEGNERFAEIVRKTFAGRDFDVTEFYTLSNAEGGCSLDALRKDRIIEPSLHTRSHTFTLATYTPSEFAEYVSRCFAEGNPVNTAVEWNADSGMFLETETHAYSLYRVVG